MKAKTSDVTTCVTTLIEASSGKYIESPTLTRLKSAVVSPSAVFDIDVDVPDAIVVFHHLTPAPTQGLDCCSS